MKAYRPVIIESPFAATTDEYSRQYKAYLNDCIRDCLMNHDDAPFASHKLYTDALDDGDAVERDIGIKAGLMWCSYADACIVYIDHGISAGMKIGIANAEKHGIPVIMRTIY